MKARRINLPTKILASWDGLSSVFLVVQVESDKVACWSSSMLADERKTMTRKGPLEDTREETDWAFGKKYKITNGEVLINLKHLEKE